MFGMPYKSSSNQPFEPLPFPLGARNGMNTDKTASRLHIPHKRHLLFISIKNVVVGARENERVIFF
jgi:hypothetical protein